MKKLLLVIIMLFMVTGCGCSNDMNATYKLDDITAITSQGVEILKEDYQSIVDLLNKGKYSLEEIETTGVYTPLYVNYQDKLYAYAIYPDGVIRLTYDNKKYYLNDKNLSEDILKKLEELKNKTEESKNHTVEYFDTYQAVNGAKEVSVGSGNNMLKITFKSDVTSLNIYSQKVDENGGYVDENGVEQQAIVLDKRLGTVESMSKGSVLVIKYDKSSYAYNLILAYKDSDGKHQRLELKD